MQRKVYILENLDCANCAAKIERKLSKLPELNDVSVTFATKQLRFEAEDPEAVLPKIRETIQSMEPDVEVVERTRGKRKTAEHHHEHHEHGHEEGCGCGHDHHHEHHDHEHGHEESCGCGHEHHHDHGHTHEHCTNCGEGCQGSCTDEVVALLNYMLSHNEHHAEELDQMAENLKKMGMEDAAKTIKEGVADFQKGNMRLGLALTLVKEHLKEA